MWKQRVKLPKIEIESFQESPKNCKSFGTAIKVQPMKAKSSAILLSSSI